MADIVLGLAASHSPQLRIPPQRWQLLLEKDQKDPRFNYRELLEKAKPDIQSQLTPEVFEAKFDACTKALAKLRDALAVAAPDLVLIIGDDQHEQFRDDNMPMFSIFYGETVEQIPRRAEKSMSWWNSEAAYSDQSRRSLPCDSAFARHLIEGAIASGFDMATSNKLNSQIGVGHAFSFVADYILGDTTAPVVPLMVNAFFPPNRPLPDRCYELGKALDKAIRRWDANKRIAIIPSGGLSHFIIDEELDEMLLHGLQLKDQSALSKLPLDRLWRLGTGEGLNWILAGGALAQLESKLENYVPCYRTPAGTGCAMGFMRWQ